jgi:hypothetical protein
VLKAYETVSVARVSTTGQTVELDVDGDKLSLSVDSSELLGYSLRETGPFTLKDLSVSLNGEKMVSCERIGWDKIQLPSYADLLLTLSEGALTMDPAQIVLKFSEMLQKSPMAFNNVSVRNVTVRNLLDRDKEQREKTIFSLAESKLSYTMTDSSNDLALHLTNLAIARLLFEDELPDSALAVLPETLVFSGGLETAVNASEASTLSLDCKNISLAVQDIFLAELSFALEGVPGVQTIFLDAPMDARLAKLDLSLSDLALSDFIFAIGAAEQSEHSDGETKAETIRNEAVTLVRAGGESLQPEPLRELASNVALFLTKSGQTFTLALHPPKPVSLKQLDIAILSNPDAFGVSSSVTAPN